MAKRSMNHKKTFNLCNMLIVLACVISVLITNVESKKKDNRKLSTTFKEAHPGTDDLTGIDWDHSTGFVDYSVSGAKTRQNFRIDFDETKQKPRYIKVEVKADNDMPAPLLYFASKDDNCFTGRQHMAKAPNDISSFLWLKKGEFEDDELFVLVECLNKAGSCDYTLSFTQYDYMEFEANFAYSYLVGEKNKDISTYVDVDPLATSVTFFAVGSPKLKLTVDDLSATARTFNYGTAITVKKEPSNASQYLVSVTGNKDDYVTIGTITNIDNKVNGEVLQPNGPEVSGLLVKTILEDQCHELTLLEDDKYKSAEFVYITGKFYEGVGEVYLRDQSFKEIDGTSTEINDGLYSKAYNFDGKKISVCVRFPNATWYSATEIPYTLSVSEPKGLANINEALYYYNPQGNGMIYRRLIPKNGIAFFSGMTLDTVSKKHDYNVYSRKGFAKMYFTQCQNFPHCQFDDIGLNRLTQPKSTNRMTTYSVPGEITDTPLSPVKNVIVVKCLDDDPNYTGYCEFETSITSSNDNIVLIPEEPFSGYALKSEKGTYSVNLLGQDKIRRINIDIMVLSGDINFSLKDTTINHHKYYLSNKIYFLINAEDNDDLTKIDIEYTASLNSFYTIQTTINRRNDGGTQFVEYLTSGISYLVAIDPTNTFKVKTVRIPNFRTKDKKPFLANFFQLNCQFSVKRGSESFPMLDGYAQELVTTSSPGYTDSTYNYVITIEEPDLSNYNHKMCMIYVAGVEQSATSIEREIITGENVNQQMIFDQDDVVFRFSYPHADPTKDLVLYVNVVDISKYRVTIYANNNQAMKIDISRSQIVSLPVKTFERFCKEDTLCNIGMEVSLVQKLIDTNPMIELTIRQVLNVPSYIQKGRAQKDFVCGERLYYLYTDIGKNEAGEVLVDFMRGTGEIYGKVVRKDQTSIDEEANWRSIYRMPSKEWEDSVEYDPFVKKLKVSTEDTSDCIEGCYLLISIQIGLSDDYGEDYRFYPFSILTRVNPANGAYTDIPKVVIQADEYIVGNVQRSENERISEFYEIWLPHDAETVEFDWESSVAGLYINLGGIRPTAKNPDFKRVPKGKDEVLTLTKSEILARAKAKGTTVPYPGTIQDINLVIGIWTDKSDSSDTEVYSLRVHESMPSDSLDIVEVVGDHKTMCKPVEVEKNQYRCLFMVVYDSEQLIKGILTHASSLDQSATTNSFARFIDRSIFDEYDESKIKNNIPTSQSYEFSTKNDGVDYIYTKTIQTDKYLFVNVISDNPSDIMFLASFYTYNYIFTPNPSGEQVFSVVESQSHLNINFATKNDIIINIVALAGEGEIYWSGSEDKYALKGRGDRLSITSGKDYADNDSKNLIITNTKTSSTNADDPGFAFYVSYFTRNPEHNVDEIIYGQSLEIAYKDTDFPVYLFSKVLDSKHDVNIALTFRSKETYTRYYFKEPLFKISASLIKESTAYSAKVNSDIVPLSEKSLVGIFDQGVSTAFLSFSKEDLQNFNIREDDNPTIYIQIKKTDDKLVYPNFTLEAQVTKSNDGVPALEKVYHFGRIGPDTEYNSYKLRVDKNNKIMRVQYASNGELDFYVSDQENSKTNVSGEKKQNAGKTYITFTVSTTNDYYYLNIYKKNKNGDSRLNNYIFKYINAASESNFKLYPIKDDNSNLNFKETQNGNLTDVSVTINKVEAGDASVAYYLKVVSNSTHVYGEGYNTIALMESPSVGAVYLNPDKAANTITLEATGVPSDYVYVQVVAKIQDGEITEYDSYTGIHEVRPYVPPEGISEGIDTVVFIVVGGVLLLLVIGLVVAVIIFKNRNKSLLNQVKHVSFQKTNSNTDPNLLLNKQQQQQGAEGAQPPEQPAEGSE